MEAKIHYYQGTSLDEDGEPMFGWFFEWPPGQLMGPYNSGAEAEIACQQEYCSQ